MYANSMCKEGVRKRDLKKRAVTLEWHSPPALSEHCVALKSIGNPLLAFHCVLVLSADLIVDRARLVNND